MGYDMHWVQVPDDEREAVSAAGTAFYEACAEREKLPREEGGTWSAEERAALRYIEDGAVPANASDRYRAIQERVHQLYNALHAAKRSYFRLNIWGMGRYTRAMETLGALTSGYRDDDQPPYPETIPEHYWEWESDPATPAVNDDQRVRFADIKARATAHLAWSPPGTTGIPVHKFGSNDGWHVLPEEALASASAIRATDPDAVEKALADAGITDRAYWDAWVQWLADASEHGGFTVR